MALLLVGESLLAFPSPNPFLILGHWILLEGEYQLICQLIILVSDYRDCFWLDPVRM
jgi:hypothetical protein